MRRPESTKHPESVEGRQADILKHEVERAALCIDQRLGPVGWHGAGIAGRAKPSLDEIGDTRLVFRDKDVAHAFSASG